MLYHLLVPLSDRFILFNVFRYITFRTLMAALTSLTFAFVFGGWLIEWLRRKQIGQNVRKDGPSSHLGKQGTPTMGGIIFLVSMLFSVALWARWDQALVWFCVGLTVVYGLLG